MPQPRCFHLKFDGQAERDLFFWMQEPRADADEAAAARFNAAINPSGAPRFFLGVAPLCPRPKQGAPASGRR